jgi:hypothetical protein
VKGLEIARVQRGDSGIESTGFEAGRNLSMEMEMRRHQRPDPAEHERVDSRQDPLKQEPTEPPLRRVA